MNRELWVRFSTQSKEGRTLIFILPVDAGTIYLDVNVQELSTSTVPFVATFDLERLVIHRLFDPNRCRVRRTRQENLRRQRPCARMKPALLQV